VEELIFAYGYRTGSLPTNVARVFGARAGLPIDVPAFTLNKACGGGLKAVDLAAQAIRVGDSEVVVAGGQENMSKAAYLVPKARWGYRLGHGELVDQLVLFDPISGDTMGETAENVARQYGISRQEQDLYALESQRRAEEAIKAGRFGEEIVPIEVRGAKGPPRIFDQDEHPRFGTTLEKLSRLKPVFEEGGTVTAGNSSGMNDGAAALVLMSAGRAEKEGVVPLAGVVGCCAVGVDPALMGIGPIPATRMVLEKTGLSLGDIDLIELNEAFASQSVACMRELGLDAGMVNVNGGAIALGHPISATGAVILVKLLYEMERRNCRRGLVTMCMGGGMGIAMIVERTQR
jgi:acetyl-CoA C-acetyltransferase